MADRARRQRLIIGSVVGVIILGYLLWFPQQHAAPDVRLWTTAIYFGIAAMGLNILTGYNGQVSIGHGAFFGMGAFTTAVLMRDYDWSYLTTLPVAAVLAMAVGLVAGFPALRVKGLYLALVTLGLAVLFPDLVKRFVDTGGQNLINIPRRQRAAPSWWPSAISDQHEYAFYVTLIVALVLLGVAFLLVRSRFGRSLIAVRDAEAAASTVGIDVARAKLAAFAVSAMYAGVAGSLAVLMTGTAEAGKVTTFNLSILLLLAVVIGGAATVPGPFVGAFIVVMIQDQVDKFVADPAFLPGFFKDKTVLSPAIFGIALILMMYVMPDGIVGGARRLYNRIWSAASSPRRTEVSPPIGN